MPRYGNEPCPDPEGVAWFLRGAHRRISKNHDKGLCGINVPVLGIKALVGEGKRFGKTAKRFLLICLWGRCGGYPPLRGEAEKP
jgi:hypothetical protein